MSLTEKISSDLKEAMKARDKVALEAIRAAKTALTIARTNQGSDAVLSDEEEIKIIQKLVKQRKESAEVYAGQSREDLAEKEHQEALVLEKYLPAKISDEQLTIAVTDIISQVGATSPADMGKVMGIASKSLAGKAEGKDVANKVKELLSKL